MLIQTFVLKVINNERKMLTYHEIIDRNVEQLVLVCKESKDSSKLTAAKFLIYLFIYLSYLFILLHCRHMAIKKQILLKKTRNHAQP